MDLSYFDANINRRGTDCCKWDEVDLSLGNTDCIHLGVADADFRSPECVSAAVRRLAEHGIYGYTNVFDGFYDAVRFWMRKRHDVTLEKEHIVFTPRINIALGLLVNEFSKKDTPVLLHSPYYPPLKEAAEANHRECVNLPLIDTDDGYEIDFDSLETSDRIRNAAILVLVNPHNPTGRVWKPSELVRLARFCIGRGILLFVDEIHGDLIRPGIKFTSAARLLEPLDLETGEAGLDDGERAALADLLVVAGAPAKSFNMPGAIMSYLITRSERIREGFNRQIRAVGEHNPNIFGNAMLQSAYTEEGEAYVDLLNEYVLKNENFLSKELKRLFPEAVIKKREGTYLMWVDMRKCFADEAALKDFFLNKARVAFSFGSHFGERYAGFVRINIACPIATLREVARRIESAL